MGTYFELLLSLAVVISGLICLIDRYYWAPTRHTDAKLPVIIDYSRSFFPILLGVLLLRSFLFEPFRIPSGSEKPELLIGDFILVNKFVYGLRWPAFHGKWFPIGEPKRGDVAVFRWPLDPSTYFVKRVIGLPGDRIEYHNKILTINGIVAPQKPLYLTTDATIDTNCQRSLKQEDLLGLRHPIYQCLNIPAMSFTFIVPSGHYFVLGDNRDESYDSRAWGFVPERNLVGQAVRILLSWDHDNWRVRWDRSGKAIH